MATEMLSQKQIINWNKYLHLIHQGPWQINLKKNNPNKMCTKDSQKYTALEYMNVFGVIPENANEDHKEIPFFTCHSSKGYRAVMLVEV